MKPFGTFTKALPGSLAINFSQSASSWCDDACPLKHGACYAERLERMRPTVRTHLARKQDDLAGTLQAFTAPQALNRLQTAPWVRISALGALPPPTVAREHVDAFRALFHSLPPSITHFPVERLAKAWYYKTLSPITPRLSLASRDAFAPSTRSLIDKAHANQIKSFSLVSPAPDKDPGWTKRSIRQAFRLARDLRTFTTSPFFGRRVRVCPAVAGSAKCGACQLCSDPAHNPKAADLVIYPEHR